MKFTWLLSKSLVVNLHLEIRRCDQVWKATDGHVYLSRCDTVSPLKVFVRGGVVPKEKWIKSQKTLRSDPGQCVMSWWCSFCISCPSACRAGRRLHAWPLSWALVETWTCSFCKQSVHRSKCLALESTWAPPYENMPWLRALLKREGYHFSVGFCLFPGHQLHENNEVKRTMRLK